MLYKRDADGDRGGMEAKRRKGTGGSDWEADLVGTPESLPPAQLIPYDAVEFS